MMSMYSTDADQFHAALDSLGLVFGKIVTNELRTLYWDALKDLPLSTVQRCAALHTRYAKFFPKPRELRPKDDVPKPEARDPRALREFERQADARCAELRVKSPEEWLRQVRPKVMELGLAKGMQRGEIEAKIQRYLQDGPR
jgi:hypothetical protein